MLPVKSYKRFDEFHCLALVKVLAVKGYSIQKGVRVSMWPPHPKSSLSYFVRKNSLQYVEENENLNLGKNNILFMNG